MFGKIIINDQGMAAMITEILPDGATGIGGQKLEWSWVTGRCRHHDTVLHRSVIFQDFHHTGDGRAFLANGHIDTDDVLPLLVENGVHCYGCLASLAITDDQFPLATTNGDHGIDGL